MDLREGLYAVVSAAVSAVDGIPYKTLTPQVSAFMGSLGDLVFKMMNRMDTASATLVSGGSAGAVAIALTNSYSPIQGSVQGVPFYMSGADGAFSAQPGSAASTASNQVRKVLVCLTFSALPVASSLAAGTVTFVVGSAMGTSAGAVTTGGQSAYFNLVPLPRASANQVPVGWLNIPNSWAASAGIADAMMITDPRETQGINLNMVMAGLPQP